MRTRCIGPLVLLAVLIGLAPLAHAHPPDQTWIVGLYDNADYDDVVNAATLIVGASIGAASPDHGSVIQVTDMLHESAPLPPEPILRTPHHLRGPPLA